jgi:hypothetical protein
MTVADLIHLLQQHNLDATVVLWDHTTYGAQVSKVGFGDVQTIQLGARECNGVLVFEHWVDGDDNLDGPFSGIVLGGH